MLAIVVLLFGVFCCATSVLMIKASGLHPAVLSAYRLLGAALLLSPLYFVELKRHRGKYLGRHLRASLPPAVTLALHFISWAAGAQLTTAANASLIVNMVPVVVPFLLFALIKEKISRRDVAGIALALLGVAWLAAGDFDVSRHLRGDAICFGSMLLFSVYLVQAKLNSDVPGLWLYLVPLYAVAGAICFVIALFVAEPLAPMEPRALWCVLGLAIVPTILGHSILNLSMRRLSGPVVSVCNLFQFLFAGVLAYLFFHEAPKPAFYGAGALVMSGAILVIFGASKRSRLSPKTQIDAEIEAPST